MTRHEDSSSTPRDSCDSTGLDTRRSGPVAMVTYELRADEPKFTPGNDRFPGKNLEDC